MDEGHCGNCYHRNVCQLRRSTALPDIDVAHFCRYWIDSKDVLAGQPYPKEHTLSN